MPDHLSESTLRQLRRVGKTVNALSKVSPRMAGRLAFRLFCTPRRLPLRDQDKSFFAKSTQKKIHFEGLHLHTYEWNPQHPNGQTVLLLHGWESSSARWRRLCKALQQQGYRVLALDAPASGQSAGSTLNLLLFSRAIQAVVSEFGRPYAIVGHSLGAGAPVICTTMLGVERPEKMVLMAPFADTIRVTRDFCQFFGFSDVVEKAIGTEIKRRTGQPIEAFSVVERVQLLQDITGLVIHDTDDDVAPVAEGQAIANAWNAQFLQTSGLGHRLQDNSVNEAILAFLKG